ncbi:MAG TPA: hypothetical protein VM165_01545 [Planctomycetaceae bacterium]|nr:hypothetical protein [Planctomycetaceae bacterium]
MSDELPPKEKPLDERRPVIADDFLMFVISLFVASALSVLIVFAGFEAWVWSAVWLIGVWLVPLLRVHSAIQNGERDYTCLVRVFWQTQIFAGGILAIGILGFFVLLSVVCGPFPIGH